MRKFMAKDREEKSRRGNQSQDPCSSLRMGRQADVPNLDGVALQIAFNQPNAQREDGKPTIVYADRDAVNASNCQLPFEELRKPHSKYRRSKRFVVSLACLSLLCEPFHISYQFCGPSEITVVDDINRKSAEESRSLAKVSFDLI